jgi:hypothetical protein
MVDDMVLLMRRRRLQRRRDAELRACRAKWRSRIGSIDRLLRAAATSGVVKSQTKLCQARPLAVLANALEDNTKQGRKAGVLKLVRHILRGNRGFFTASTLCDLINQTSSFTVTRRELSRPIGSLRQLGEIKLVETGKGRKAHMYLKL